MGERLDLEMETLRVHLEYLRAKASLWDARAVGDADDEMRANSRVQQMLPKLAAVLR
ncbi:hypothetical protein [Microbacterium neimengense]